MSVKLTVILFAFESNVSLSGRLPLAEDLMEMVTKYSEQDLEIIIFDPEAESSNEGKVTRIKKPYHDWNVPFDKIAGEVVFIAFSEAEVDVYSIMEDLETQKYSDRYYFNVFKKEPLNIQRYLTLWSKYRPLPDEMPSSPKAITESKDNEYIYQLYSGNRIRSFVSDIDREAIKWRIILLAETIKVYLRAAFDRIYDIGEMRKLRSIKEGYDRPAFYSEEEIRIMVENSAFFQAEDPIIKGFILAHPIQVIARTSEQGKVKFPSISPLDIGRSVQWLIFNHGQFREELLSSMMKVVANFAKNNKFLFEEDIPEEKIVSASKTIEKKKKIPTVVQKRGVSVTSSIVRSIEYQEEEEEKPIIKKTINKAYRTQVLWSTIITRIKDSMKNEDSD